jgi:hypothetical protein
MATTTLFRAVNAVRWSLIALLVTLLFLTACGGSGSTPGEAATAQSVAPVSSATVSSQPAPVTVQTCRQNGLYGTYPDCTSTAPVSSAPASSAPVSSAPVSPPPPVPTMALTDTAHADGSYTLTWLSTNTTACYGAAGWPGPDQLPPSGTVSTPVLTVTTSYSVTCTGPGGNATSSLTVGVSGGTQAPPSGSGPPGTSPGLPAPSITLTASPATIAPGGTATLTWTSSADYCSGILNLPGPLPPSGSLVTDYLTASMTYTLACFVSGADSEATVTVTVAVPVPTLSVQLAIDPVTVADDAQGVPGYAVLTVTAVSSLAGDVVTCTPPNGAPIGPFDALQDGPQVIAVNCTSVAGGAGQASITLTVVPAAAPPVDTFTGALSGGIETLTWDTFQGQACAVSQANDDTGTVLTLTPGGTSSGSAVSGFLSSGVAYTFTLECAGVADAGVATITVSP